MTAKLCNFITLFLLMMMLLLLFLDLDECLAGVDICTQSERCLNYDGGHYCLPRVDPANLSSISSS